MKKSLILSAAAAVTLVACSAADNPNRQEGQPVGMANPASEFCVKQGGKLEPKKDAHGNEYALCHLPDGTVMEEWEYFRKHSK